MDTERLNNIYDKTDGRCHICYKVLSFSNYGKNGQPGAWHIEHSIPRAKGGTDHLNNLFPACIQCNLDKGTKHTRTARAKHGNTRAPYSYEKKKKIEQNNTLAGAVTGGIVGAFAGPVGIVIGTVVGALIGNGVSPEK